MTKLDDICLLFDAAGDVRQLVLRLYAMSVKERGDSLDPESEFSKAISRIVAECNRLYTSTVTWGEVRAVLCLVFRMLEAQDENERLQAIEQLDSLRPKPVQEEDEQ